VLEPLCGYLALVEKLYTAQGCYADAWNFGPNDGDSRSVSWIVKELCDRTGGGQYSTDRHDQPHEANVLSLDSSKAKAVLGWAPRWDLETALSKTLEWHNAWRSKADMAEFTCRQIQSYISE
jgi:CDP-glucose 4,6-dehydratase